jgi:hypothetical protein
MNKKEIIDTMLTLKEVPRQPAVLMSAGAWALNSNGLSLEKALEMEHGTVADVLYRAYTDAGSDVGVCDTELHNIVIGSIGGKIKFRTKGTPDVVETLVKKP